MHRAPRIAVVGAYGLGVTMRMPRLPLPGETVAGGALSMGPGGKGSNQAIAARRLGAEVDLLTVVGADSLGRDAVGLWEREGVRAHAVIEGTRPTMSGMILVEEGGGENRIVLDLGALGDLRPSHVDAFAATIAAADLLVVSLEIPLGTALHALHVGHESGVRTLLNPAPAPSTAVPAEAWVAVDVLTPNETELDLLLGRDTDGRAVEERAAELHRRTGSDVVVTLGAEGAAVADGGPVVRVPAAAAERVVDTTGAGDAFTGALAVALARGGGLVEAVRLAALAGAHCVGIPEVVPALPHASDLDHTTTTGKDLP